MVRFTLLPLWTSGLGLHSSCSAETLYLLNGNLIISPNFSVPGDRLSPLCFYCDYLRCVLSLGTCMEYLSFCDQFLSLGITSSRFTMWSHMPGFPSILRLSNSPLYVCNIHTHDFVYWFIRWWIIGFFDNWAVVNKAATNPAVQRSLWDPVFTSFGYVSKNGTAGSRGSSSFNFLRNLYTDFCSGCTNSHSHQQYTSVPFSPSPGQSLLSLLFLIIAILMSIWWSHLICISLMISDFGHLSASIQFLPSVIFWGLFIFLLLCSPYIF